jgi:single-strand selective monofunctional uracil DNA glycosylase
LARGKRVVFVGMNPGPFGMVQTGVPFGEIAAVRDWMGIEAEVANPRREPQAPDRGLRLRPLGGERAAPVGAVRRAFRQRRGLLAEHFVANYCPLAFFDGGRNLTPDKLPAAEQGRCWRPATPICGGWRNCSRSG